MTTYIYEFKVTTKEAGQRRKYGDSYYEYHIEAWRSLPGSDHGPWPVDEAMVNSFAHSLSPRTQDARDMSHPFTPERTHFFKGSDPGLWICKKRLPSTH